MSKDLHHVIDTKEAFPISDIGTDTTLYGDATDQRGFESFELSFVSGIIVDGTYTITLQESDDNTFASGVTEIPADRLLGSYSDIIYTTGENNTIKRIGFLPTKTYFRVKLVSSGVTSGGALSAQFILGDPENAPTIGDYSPLA